MHHTLLWRARRYGMPSLGCAHPGQVSTLVAVLSHTPQEARVCIWASIKHALVR